MLFQISSKIRVLLLLLAGSILFFSLPSCRSSRRTAIINSIVGVSGPLSDREVRQIIETARSYTGTPYLTGGTSRSGIDCSGLVAVSFSAVGREMPRISYQQAEVGYAVGENELAPGDLVFFTDRKGNQEIHHVGLITEVKRPDVLRFIHASTSLGVVENNLKQRYWANVFLKGVRIK